MNQSRTIFTGIKDEIIRNLSDTSSSVNLMLAWLTNKDLLFKLHELASKGKKINLILSNSDWNYISYHELLDISNTGNCKIRSTGSKTPNSKESDSFMHRKICIIDDLLVMNGSYNWTKNATSSMEDYTFTFDKQNALYALIEFDKLWNTSSDFFTSKNKEEIDELIQKYSTIEEQGKSPAEQFFDTQITEEIISPQNNILKTPSPIVISNELEKNLPVSVEPIRFDEAEQYSTISELPEGSLIESRFTFSILDLIIDGIDRDITLHLELIIKVGMGIIKKGRLKASIGYLDFITILSMDDRLNKIKKLYGNIPSSLLIRYIGRLELNFPSFEIMEQKQLVIKPIMENGVSKTSLSYHGYYDKSYKEDSLVFRPSRDEAPMERLINNEPGEFDFYKSFPKNIML